jgi:hypothetical protein
MPTAEQKRNMTMSRRTVDKNRQAILFEPIRVVRKHKTLGVARNHEQEKSTLAVIIFNSNLLARVKRPFR